MTAPRRSTTLLLAACLTVGLAACSSDEPADTAGGDAGGSSEAAVDIVDNDFEPADVEVASGGTVTWTNTGDVVHTVTFDDGPDSGDMESGGTFSETFDEAGDHSYTCTIHPTMEGTVTVTG